MVHAYIASYPLDSAITPHVDCATSDKQEWQAPDDD
jgi:hypothetical protein